MVCPFWQHLCHMLHDEQELYDYFQGLAQADADLQGRFIGLAPEHIDDYVRGAAAMAGWRLALDYPEGRLEGGPENTRDVLMIALEVVNHDTRASNEATKLQLYKKAKQIGLGLLRQMLADGLGLNVVSCGTEAPFQLSSLNGVRYFKLKGVGQNLYGYRFEIGLSSWINSLPT